MLPISDRGQACYLLEPKLCRKYLPIIHPVAYLLNISLASEIFFFPYSFIKQANSCRVVSSFTSDNLSNMGKFTPVKTSTFPSFMNDSEMLEGVPPKRSVRIN